MIGYSSALTLLAIMAEPELLVQACEVSFLSIKFTILDDAFSWNPYDHQAVFR